MIKTVHHQQLGKLLLLGYEGEGDLDSIIEWLGKGFVDLSQDFHNQWHSTSYYDGKEYSGGGNTPLEAVYNLAIAVNGGK